MAAFVGEKASGIVAESDGALDLCEKIWQIG
jgi:hypothetical protein